MEFSKDNWHMVLDDLEFCEQKNPNGGYNIFNDFGCPVWQYENEKEKEKLYYFFSGAVYWKLHSKGVKK